MSPAQTAADVALFRQLSWADRTAVAHLLVLDQGSRASSLFIFCLFFVTCQVAEEGTHDELVSAEGGVYAGLVKRQLDLGDSSSSSNGGGKKGELQLGGDTPKLGLSKRV